LNVKLPTIITLTTDFGLQDPYVGIMKGIILGRCPQAVIVDLSHMLAPQDVMAGMLCLEAAHQHFPPGTVHMAVVDPGVGSNRKIVALRAKSMTFLAPDNGLLSFIEPAEIEAAHAVEYTGFFLNPPSPTFHGRDIFAPVAAALASGTAPCELGPAVNDIVRIERIGSHTTESGVTGKILTFDRFGNAITSIKNLPADDRGATVKVGGRSIPLKRTFADVAPGEPVAYMGSRGHLEVAVRNDDARRTLGLGQGDTVELESNRP